MMRRRRNTSMLNKQPDLLSNLKNPLNLLPLSPGTHTRTREPQNPMFLRHPHNAPIWLIHNAGVTGRCACLFGKSDGACVEEGFVAFRVDAADFCEDSDSLLGFGDEGCVDLLEIVGGVVSFIVSLCIQF